MRWENARRLPAIAQASLARRTENGHAPPMNVARLREIADEIRAEIQESARGADLDIDAEDATARSLHRITLLAKLEAAEEIIRGVISRA